MKVFHFLPLIFTTISAFAFNGTRLPDVEVKGRIFNGIYTMQEQFSYQVGLELQSKNNRNSWCSGALIDKKFVLTAAHCLWNVERALVYLGSTVLLKGQKLFVLKTDFIIHSDFDMNTRRDNIALIKIPAVALTPKINIVNLPPVGHVQRSSYYDCISTASGWGKLYINSDVISEHLRAADYRIITKTICKSRYRKLPENSICLATTNGMSANRGDGGGPLVIKGSKTLIGIFSSVSKPKNDLDFPAIYVRVVNYLNWINKNMAKI